MTSSPLPIPSAPTPPSQPTKKPLWPVISKFLPILFLTLFLSSGLIAGTVLTRKPVNVAPKAGGESCGWCANQGSGSGDCPHAPEHGSTSVCGGLSCCQGWNGGSSGGTTSGGTTSGGTTSGGTTTSGGGIGGTCGWCAGADQCQSQAHHAPEASHVAACGGLDCCQGYTPPAGSTTTTTTTSGTCNPGDGTLPFNGDTWCGAAAGCPDGKAKLCPISGKWADAQGCVAAHACNYVPTWECGQKPDGSYQSCQDLGYAAGVMCDPATNRCTISGKGYFTGCGDKAPNGDGNACHNCYSSGVCLAESTSCGANVICHGGTTTTNTTVDTQIPTQPTSPPTNPTNPPDLSFFCSGIASSRPSPKVGETAVFTCSATGSGIATVNAYHFRYKIDSGAWTNIGVSSTQFNISIGLPITSPGAYTVQCQACAGTNCTTWNTL